MLKIEDLKGVMPPIVTPVDAQENVDEQGLKNVIDYVLDGGVHGVFVLGSNGEFYALDFENQKKAVEITVNHVNGRVPVFAGASAITTKECIKLAQMAEEAGADALTVLTPMFIKPNEKELYNHFEAIAKSTKLPVLLYNNPDKTTNNISVSLLEKLAKIDNIVGIKNTSFDFAQTIEYIRVTKDIPNFKVLSGSDYLIYGTLAYGGAGCVAGTANVAPKLVVEIYDKYMAGDYEGAMEAQYKLIPLRNAYSYGSFPVVMKDCMNLIGVKVGDPVKPIEHCTEEKLEELKKILRDLDLIK
ncbi:dihydrodipicolinate synthase DapA [Clostridium aceticum]|uniref:4-hydroxy-tetrahydrodipicolinate synthase n=1 Tax=Clostridium aceticum TaxID=84022 RepID=A0A0D8I8Z3_9CLOT|nr:4-hydroxy-tetrahydrodipicolinate synthase [Clostridium aceticum]AKL94608.1 dihydrodipicolinate synthase DapA [Clostridium aceticum]KJF26487.1 dihydrodipicolinate synthase [Clostridium aceticum]